MATICRDEDSSSIGSSNASARRRRGKRKPKGRKITKEVRIAATAEIVNFDGMDISLFGEHGEANNRARSNELTDQKACRPDYCPQDDTELVASADQTPLLGLLSKACVDDLPQDDTAVTSVVATSGPDSFTSVTRGHTNLDSKQRREPSEVGKSEMN